MNSETNNQQEQIDLEDVLQEIKKNQAGTLLAHAGINFQLNVELGLPFVLAEPELLRRLLHGLINRAIARSRPGNQIEVQAKGHKGQVWVSIHDEGPSLSSADLPHIFDKSFVKMGSSLGTTGLEMAMVKTIMDRMNGQVWVGNQGNKGATIIVCLPTTPQPQPAD